LPQYLSVAAGTSFNAKMGWLTDPSKYVNVAKGKPSRAEVSDADLERLLESGIIRRVREEDVLSYARLFTIPEVDKQRRRVICHPVEVNDGVSFASTLGGDFAPADALVQQLFTGSHAARLDLRAGYYQLPLADQVQRYYAVRVKGNSYVFTRAVMGGSPFADVCHFVTRIIAEAGASLAGAHAVYIDGARFVGTERQVNAAVAATKRRALEVGATFNDDDYSRPRVVSPWNGAEYDFGAKTVRLLKRTVEKLKPMTDIELWTFRELSENMGRIFPAAAILGHRWYKSYYLLKLYRRQMAKYQVDPQLADVRIAVWKRATEHYRALMATLLTNAPRRATEVIQPQVTVFVDASTVGWGAVVEEEGRITFFGAKWKPTDARHHINVLEALAIGEAVTAFAAVLRGKAVRFVIDNTSAKITLFKQRSKAYELDRAVERVWGILDGNAGRLGLHPHNRESSRRTLTWRGGSSFGGGGEGDCLV
jgi:hypothetical protein